MVKFLSRQWFEIAEKIAKESLDPKKDLNNASASLLNIINNVPPDGKTTYFYISVNKGIITDMKLDQNNSLIKKDAEFIVRGNYDTFKQIFKGEMNILIALIKNRIEIKGDKKKALNFIKPIESLNSCLRNIETNY